MRAPRAWLALAALAAVLVVWTVLALLDIGFTDRPGWHMGLAVVAVVALLATVAAGFAEAAGRRRDGDRTTSLEAERDEAREAARKSEEERQNHGRKLVYLLKEERRWNRKLRAKALELQTQHKRWSASTSDVRELVLRIAIELTEAERGLLLSQSDDDGDGRLDVVAEHGFESDASRSELAQRFAQRVMKRDEIVREDDPGNGSADADDEIHSLVAVPIYISDDFSGVVICADRPGGFRELDDDVLLSLGDHAGAVLQNAKLHGQLRDSFVSTIRLLSEAIQAKDPFLRGHSEDVARHVEGVARRLELEPERRERLVFASLLHDLGKIGISERLLLKPGRLSPEERGIVELHPRIGYRLVEQVPGMDEIAPAILYHHERFDGAGYPARLAGDAIPLEARIIGVADAFSAMTEQRPYRDRMGLEDACGELERCAGTQFDPEIVRLFVEEVRRDPGPPAPSILATALADEAIEARHVPGEPVLGTSAADLTDAVTLLYAHRYFHETASAHAALAATDGTPFSVGLVSLASLGEINTASGYGAGDAALRECGRALARVAVRHGGTACRIGGSRIALLVGATGPEGAVALADEIALELGEIGWTAGCRVAGITWRAGEDATSMLDRGRTLLRAGRTMAPLSD